MQYFEFMLFSATGCYAVKSLRWKESRVVNPPSPFPQGEVESELSEANLTVTNARGVESRPDRRLLCGLSLMAVQ